jgi:small subunit ribosomal protein S4
VLVNGRLCDVPSYLVRVGDTIQVKGRTKSLDMVKGNLAENKREVPDFLALSESSPPEGRMVRLPAPEDVSIPVETQLIVELCSM